MRITTRVRYRGAVYQRVTALADSGTLPKLNMVVETAQNHAIVLVDYLDKLNLKLQKKQVPSADMLDALTDKTRLDYMPKIAYSLLTTIVSLHELVASIKRTDTSP